jgi:acetyl esterase/lipase
VTSEGRNTLREVIIVLAILLASAAAEQTETQPKQAAPFLGPQQVNELPASPADHRIRYGDDPEQFGDLRLPTEVSGRFPVAVVIHGGCWKAKHGSLIADLNNTGPIASALTELGIATWNIEYRRVDIAGGGWPGTFEDVANGVEQVRGLAQSYPLDLNRVVIIGHSAGGHLGTWIAARHRLPEQSRFFSSGPLRILGVVNLAGPTDLESFVPIQSQVCGDPVITQLMGGSPIEVPDRYRAASPARLLPIGVRQVVITGAHDRIVPAALGRTYEETARAHGDDVTALVVPDAAHFEVIAPGSTAWPVVGNAVLSILGLLDGR